MRVLCHLKLQKKMVNYNREVGQGGGARRFYSGVVVYVIEPVNSVFSNYVYSVFSSQSQGHIFIIAKLRLTSSAASLEMFFTYKKHRASTAA